MRLSYRSRNTSLLRLERCCSRVMALCCILSRRNRSSPSKMGHIVRCLRSRFSLSGFAALSSGGRYTTGTPGAIGDSAKITRSLVVIMSELDCSSGGRLFERDSLHFIMAAGGSLSSFPPQWRDWAPRNRSGTQQCQTSSQENRKSQRRIFILITGNSFSLCLASSGLSDSWNWDGNPSKRRLWRGTSPVYAQVCA